MLSRVANSIYWMNRYIERAENVSRFIDVNLHLMLDMPSGTNEQWEPLLSATGDLLSFRERFGEPTRENVVAFLTFDGDNPNSIFSCLREARENARSVRDIITADMWEQINTFYLMVRGAASTVNLSEAPHEFFTEIKMASHLYQGITDATMAHGEGWHFGRLGRLLERANMISRILDVMYFNLLPDSSDVGGPVDDVRWSALLESVSAFEMYRQRHGPITSSRVAEFLTLDREFPRSMYSCVINAEESLLAISGSPVMNSQNSAEQKLHLLSSELERSRIDDIIIGGLHEFIYEFQTKLGEIGGSVFDTYFALPIADTFSSNVSDE